MIEEKISHNNKAVLIGIITDSQSEDKLDEYLKELEFLSYTAGIKSKKKFWQKLYTPNPKTFLGTGKIKEIKEYVEKNDIGIVIFDDELSPAQFKNIEKIIPAKILDRTNLILDIFAQRAETSSAKTQVELAQYEYLLPRLTGMWTHLERQRGGTGTRGGSGEKELETDKRIVRTKINNLKKKLQTIDKQMSIQRQNRGKMVRVSLVGYTNVGKSTIMNLVSKTNVLAENKLFATLDTKVKKVTIKNLPFLLSDTVGFIRKLPTQLVESFKSTLDEVRDSDIILHIVDISHPSFEDHINSVNKILSEINAANKPTIIIFNKIDNYTFIKKDDDDLTHKEKENYSLEELEKTWISKTTNNYIFISAKNKTNLDDFKNKIYNAVYKIHTARFPYNDFLYN